MHTQTVFLLRGADLPRKLDEARQQNRELAKDLAICMANYKALEQKHERLLKDLNPDTISRLEERARRESVMPEHDYIERCPNCGKYMTWEQMQNHNCAIKCPSFSVKEIPILYCCETQDENGKVFLAHGLDGTMYRLVEKKLADEKKHSFRTDEEEPVPALGILLT